jgi:hypothetical protein
LNRGQGGSQSWSGCFREENTSIVPYTLIFLTLYPPTSSLNTPEASLNNEEIAANVLKFLWAPKVAVGML